MLRIILIILCLTTQVVFAEGLPNQPLPAEQAFKFNGQLDKKNQLQLDWQMAKDYYLYKNKIKITPTSVNQVAIEPIQLPKGKVKTDEINGTYQVYSDTLHLTVKPLKATGILSLTVSYQGCSAKGFCYPPVKKDIRVNLANPAKNIVITGEMTSSNNSNNRNATGIASIFNGSSEFLIVLTFLGFGLLLAFTPCVLPMIPILSSIIVGHKHITTKKAFLLSLMYVLGMSLTYAVAGIIVAVIGSHIQTFFQSPAVIILGSGLFILLAFSLFGFYEIELPKRWQKKVTTLSNQQKGGTHIGAFFMGVLSSLMISPCVTAPLVGVLAYIAESGDIVLGGFSLLALGFGMGIPLLLIGASAGRWLPKAGPWMEGIKKAFGFMLLGIAILLLTRIIPGPLSLLLWATLLISVALFLTKNKGEKKFWQNASRGLGLACLTYGAVLMVAGIMGHSDPLRPWVNPKMLIAKQANFEVIKNMEQLEASLSAAKRDNQPVLIDFYADWCTACISMDRNVFSKNTIQHSLEGYKLLRVDVTKNSDFDKELLKRFKVIAPPTVLFFDQSGQERINDRIVGEVDDKEFFKFIQKFELAQN